MQRDDMLVLFTDFGLTGPYTGQVKAVLHGLAPGMPVVDLFCDAPSLEPQLAAHLLAAYAPELPPASVYLCVVDPGVGTERRAVVVEADGRCFVGPDNGLFDVVTGRARLACRREIVWRPERLSASFHGRDLFAPVAARLAVGSLSPTWLGPAEVLDSAGAADLDRVIYIDGYGNVMTGRRASTLGPDAILVVSGRRLRRARTFGAVMVGEAFWFENSSGLVELAVNRGRADRVLGLRLGDAVRVVEG